MNNRSFLLAATVGLIFGLGFLIGQIDRRKSSTTAQLPDLDKIDLKSKAHESTKKPRRLSYYGDLMSAPTMAVPKAEVANEEEEKDPVKPKGVEKAESSDRVAKALANVLGNDVPEPVKQAMQSGLPSSTGSRFAVQVASSTDRSKAEQYLRSLSGKGYEARLVQATVGANITYRVRLHGYTTREEAEIARLKFEAREGRVALTVAQ